MKKSILSLALLAVCSAAFATTPAAPAPGGFNLGSLGLLAIFVVIFYFLLIRPQMKRNKEQRNLMNNLDKGDEVVTTGGILGKITKVGDNFIELNIADNVQIKIQKQSVSNVMPKGSIKTA